MPTIDRLGAPIQANRTKSLITTIFNFAEDQALIEYNPAVRVEGSGAETRPRAGLERG